MLGFQAISSLPVSEEAPDVAPSPRLRALIASRETVPSETEE